MKPPCEQFATEFLPALRAKVAKTLIDVYGFTQSEAAKRIGTTQPAVSQYRSEQRGKSRILGSNPVVSSAVERLARMAAEGALSPDGLGSETCAVCRALRESVPKK
jgi:hypothetical protein